MRGAADRPLKIGEAARRLGMSESALRFYEQQGLLTPARTPGGTRLYYPRHLRRLQALRDMQQAGVPLEDIRALMQAREGAKTGDDGSRRVARLLRARLRDIQQQRARLQETERQLREALALVEGCRGCANQPDAEHCPDCPVNRHREEVPLVELFWE